MFKVSIEEKLNVFTNETLKSLLEDGKRSEENWKEPIPGLSQWYNGRNSVLVFVIETLNRYIEESNE